MYGLPFHLCPYQEKWTREDFLQLRQQLVDGKLLSVDQSFKFAKLVRVRLAGRGPDTKPFHSVVTFFNEFEQASAECLMRCWIFR